MSPGFAGRGASVLGHGLLGASGALDRRALLLRLAPLLLAAWRAGARRRGDTLEPRRLRGLRQETAPARVRVGPVSGLPRGEATIARLDEIAVLVVNDGDGFRAVSAVCTHEECEVEWNRRAAEVRCPCHDGRFDLDGRVKSGPPPAPLVRFATEVIDGELWVVDREPEGWQAVVEV